MCAGPPNIVIGGMAELKAGEGVAGGGNVTIDGVTIAGSGDITVVTGGDLSSGMSQRLYCTVLLAVLGLL